MFDISFWADHDYYGLDVTIYGHSNFCSFVHDGKKVNLAPMRSVHLPDTNDLMHQATRKHEIGSGRSLSSGRLLKGLQLSSLLLENLLMTSKNIFLMRQSQYWRSLLMCFQRNSLIIYL